MCLSLKCNGGESVKYHSKTAIYEFCSLDDGNSGTASLSSGNIDSLEGGYRVTGPDETFKRLSTRLPEELVSIKQFRADHLDKIGIPVFWTRVCCFGKWNHIEPFYQWGKGFTENQARVSAVAESVERLCANVFSDTPLISGTFREFRNEALDPGTIINDTDFAKKHHVKYNDNMPVEWRWGYDIIQNKAVLIPAVSVHFPYPVKENENFANQGTNGLASGNCFVEAVLQGLLELVERDGTYIFLRNRICAPDIDPGSIEWPENKELIRHLTDSNIDVYIKNFTTDIEIGTVGVLLIEEKNPYGPFITHGFGSHLNSEIALLRAVTEAIQTRSFYLRQFRNFTPDERSKFQKSNYVFTEHYRAAYECMYGKGKCKMLLSELPNTKTGSLYQALDETLARVSKVLDLSSVYIVNLTRPEIGFPVVRVVAPELQYIDHQHYCTSKRMYEIPKKLGYTKQSTTPESIYKGLLP